MEKSAGLYVPGDADPNTVYSTGVNVQCIRDNGNFLYVEDPQLGTFTVGGTNTKYDKLMYALMTTPAMVRSEGISQLCKDESSATIPNTAYFTRRAGMTGLYHVNEYFSGISKLSPQQRLSVHLKQTLPDAAHKLFSHTSELRLQKWGGAENKHETDYPDLAVHGGIANVLGIFDVRVDVNMQLKCGKLPAWTTAESPELTPDNIQYTASEALEWFDTDAAPDDIRAVARELGNLKNYSVDEEGNIAFLDEQQALRFAKVYLLLATEHWNDPVNRMQLYLLIEAIQRLILERRLPWMNAVDRGQMRRPEGYFYGIDHDITTALNENHGHTDPTLFAIQGAMYPIASVERRRFVRYKQHEYARFLLDDEARDYPSEHLEPKRVEFGLSHPMVSTIMQPATAEDYAMSQKMPVPHQDSERLLYDLMPLKNRYVDPRVMDPKTGQSKRLSEINANYKRLLEQQQALQGMKTVVELVFAEKFRANFASEVRKNDRNFDLLADMPPFTHDQKRQIINEAAERAKAIAVASGRLVLS